MDVKEQRRKRDRELYAQMIDEEKREKLRKRREAYKKNKSIKKTKKYADLKQIGRASCRERVYVLV